MDRQTTVKFGDVVRKVSNKLGLQDTLPERYVAGRHMDTGDLKIRRWGYVDKGYLGPAFNSFFIPGQVLYGSRRTYLRKVAVAHFEGICANTTFVLESSNPELLLPNFLPVLMSTEKFHRFSELNSKGSVTPYINFSDLAKFEFILPPLKEQQRQILLFELMQSQINNLRNSVSNLNMVITKAMDQFLHLGELELSNPDNESPELASNNWKLLTVGDFTLEHKQGYYTTEKYTTHGAHLIRITDLQNPNIDISSAPLLDLDEKTLNSFKVEKGDFLFARSGTIGTYGIAEKDYNAVFGSYIIRFRFNSEMINPYYFGLFFQSSFCKKQMPAVTQSAVNTNVNARNLKTLHCLVPPLDFQNVIVKKLTSLLVQRQTLELMIENTHKLCLKLVDGNEVTL